MNIELISLRVVTLKIITKVIMARTAHRIAIAVHQELFEQEKGEFYGSGIAE